MYKDTMLGIVEKMSGLWGGRDAMVIRRKIKLEKVKYKELVQWVAGYRTWFEKNKIKVGDKVLFWGMNSPEYAVTYLACMSLGRVPVPVDWRNSKETIRKIVGKTKPKLAFVSKYFDTRFLKMKKVMLEEVFEKVVKEEVLKVEKGQNILENQERIAEVVFTSGTTGEPKGVIIKQKNLIANILALEKSLPTPPHPRMVSIMPLSHMLEQVVGLWLPLMRGATIYYVPRVNSLRLMQAFTEYKPTHVVLVPQILRMLWQKVEEKAAEEKKLKVLKIVMRIAGFWPIAVRRIMFRKIYNLWGGKLNFIACGGAPLDVVTAKNWLAVGVPVIEGYGATEATAAAVINDINSPKFGSVGKVLAGISARIDDDGQLNLKGPSVTDGYFEDTEKTKLVFKDGWYKTGDIGEIDNEGYVYIRGREVFKIVLPNGEKVFVEDVESKIRRDENVKDVCVVAKKLSDGDQIYAYFLLNKSSSNKPLKEIVAKINDSLESKQQIMNYSLWLEEDFPRTPTLKIDRKAVYDLLNNGGSADGVTKNKEATVFNYKDIADILAKLSGMDREKILTTDTLAGDLGIDSLTRTELVAMAEEYLGIILDESLIGAKTTVGELEKFAESSHSVEDQIIPNWQFGWWGEKIRWLCVALVIALHSRIVKMDVVEKGVVVKPGAIILFNHPGLLDGVCVIRWLWFRKIKNTVTNAAIYFWTPRTWKSLVLEIVIGGIPLYESGNGLMRVLQVDSDLLDRDYALLFSPQGSLQRSDEELPFKPGTGYLIGQLERPVYIVKIEGYRDIWPAPEGKLTKAKFKDLLPRKRGTVKVKISEEITLDWKKYSPIQITNILEEKYQEL